MVKIVLWIYDKFRKAPLRGLIFFVLITVTLVYSFLHISYKEDITDFLPLDDETQTALSVYQDISGANNIYALVSLKDTFELDKDEIIAGVDRFVEILEYNDTADFISKIVKDVNLENFMDITDIVYENIPFFLNDDDYDRIDSLLSGNGYIKEKLEEDKQMLLLPSSNTLVATISRDPLGLFYPVLDKLKHVGVNIDFEIYDGYILSPDGQSAVVILESSFGARESENNSKLISLLYRAKADAESENPNLDIHLIGGPVIAVGNAERIKNDSIKAIVIAGVLILALLIYVFRNLRNILLILVSIGWGWIFAMAIIAIHYDTISIIVLGITSVILGLAVNYPLHLIDHLKDSENPRQALSQIVSPLIVGNITTVGAFLCLIPLDSPALHDLGLFSSLLLIGTILFVLIFLPHVIKIRSVVNKKNEYIAFPYLAKIKPEESKIIVIAVCLLTVVFACFGYMAEFDSDIRNINYMTESQISDMNYYGSLVNQNNNDKEEIYVVGFGEDWDDAITHMEKIEQEIDSIISSVDAYRKNQMRSFLVSGTMQKLKLWKWNEFLDKYSSRLFEEMNESMSSLGFSRNAFVPFEKIMKSDYEFRDFDYFQDFINTVFAGTLSKDNLSGKKTIVETLLIPTQSAQKVRESISSIEGFDGIVFDVKSMNGAIANSLSDDFNYIGFVCGAIVFVFLWISFGRIELAIISFLPMAVSWIWILGIMGILGIKFNIVNIILATFIFGQGDDYTIFITEGLCYELAYRKKVLESYKNSIMISALIMFIGIGTLLFAKHPALHSLGEVTVVGMLSVVLMAYLFPPLVFKWLTQKNGKLRLMPITLGSVFIPGRLLYVSKPNNEPYTMGEALRITYGRFIYKGLVIERSARKVLNDIRCAAELLESIDENKTIIVIDGSGAGELGILLSLLYPSSRVDILIEDADRYELCSGSLRDLDRNIYLFNNLKELLYGYDNEKCTVIFYDKENGVNFGMLEELEG